MRKTFFFALAITLLGCSSKESAEETHKIAPGSIPNSISKIEYSYNSGGDDSCFGDDCEIVEANDCDFINGSESVIVAKLVGEIEYHRKDIDCANTSSMRVGNQYDSGKYKTLAVLAGNPWPSETEINFGNVACFDMCIIAVRNINNPYSVNVFNLGTQSENPGERRTIGELGPFLINELSQRNVCDDDSQEQNLYRDFDIEWNNLIECEYAEVNSNQDIDQEDTGEDTGDDN